MTDKIDYEAIAALCMEINDRVKLICNIFPVSKEHLLKHVAANSIHMALFSKDLLQHQRDNNEPESDHVKHFLKYCGCKDAS